MSQTRQSRNSKSKIGPEPVQDPRAAFLNIDDYITIKAAYLELKECAKYLSEWPGERVVDLWKFGEPKGRPQAVLEIAIRYLSGCTTFRVNPEAALYALDTFHQPDTRDYVGGLATPPDRARAHSCAAHAHYQKFRASEKERMSYAADERHYRRRQTLDAGLGHLTHTSLRFALHEASESARLEHVSAIVLRVGFAAREIGEGLGVDFSRLVERSKKFRPLWRAVDDRLNEVYAEARKARALDLDGAEQSPPECVCGAEGCGTRSASTSSSLKACSGRCPLDLKPRYCSKQCQVKDWSRHKEICKPGNVGKIPKIPNRLIALEWFELEDPEPQPAPVLSESPVPQAKPSRSAEFPLHDALPQDEPSAHATEDEKPQRGNTVLGHEGATECVARDVNVDEENTLHVREHAIYAAKEAHEAEGSLSTRESEPDHPRVVPPGQTLSEPTSTSILVDPHADDRGPQKCYAATQESPEDPAKPAVQEAGDDDDDDETRAVAVDCTVEDSQDSQPEGTDDSLPVSSPPADDSDRAPPSPSPSPSPPGLPTRTAPRPIVFGSISLEYLRTMWEEEGPAALTNTGVWAAKVPTTFVAPC
ncbi:hypothetical protein V8D89_004872 [Ganoderma adspersum]